MTDTLIHRAFQPDLEVRSAAKGGDGRTIVGIAVPYNQPQYIDKDLTEEFLPGAFDHQLRAANRVRLTREHHGLGGHLIGRATELRDDARGLYGEFRVSNTPAGDETLELVKDGVLSHLSIGFRQPEGGYRRSRAGVVQRSKVNLFEVSVVMEGAYSDEAVVTGVRSVGGGIQRSNLAELEQIIATLPVLPPLT